MKQWSLMENLICWWKLNLCVGRKSNKTPENLTPNPNHRMKKMKISPASLFHFLFLFSLSEIRLNLFLCVTSMNLNRLKSKTRLSFIPNGVELCKSCHLRNVRRLSPLRFFTFVLWMRIDGSVVSSKLQSFIGWFGKMFLAIKNSRYVKMPRY